MNDLKGFAQLSKKLKSMDKKLAEKVLRRGSAKMAQVISKEMKQAAPRNSGNLRKSITYTNKRSRSGGYFAKVGAFKTKTANGFYAKFVEFGTSRHAIKPKNKKTLSVGGNHYREVSHPGAKARPFIEPAFERARKRAVNESGRLMFKLLSSLK